MVRISSHGGVIASVPAARLVAAAIACALSIQEGKVHPTANLAEQEKDLVGVAARTILIAVLSNTVTKTSMAVSVGAPELRKAMLPIAALLLVAGVAAVFLL